jgi:hypothetical protein
LQPLGPHWFSPQQALVRMTPTKQDSPTKPPELASLDSHDFPSPPPSSAGASSHSDDIVSSSTNIPEGWRRCTQRTEYTTFISKQKSINAPDASARQFRRLVGLVGC